MSKVAMVVSAQVQLSDRESGNPSVRMFRQRDGYDYDDGTELEEAKQHFQPILDVLLPGIVDDKVSGWTQLRLYRPDGTVMLEATDEQPLPAGTADSMNAMWADGDENFMTSVQRHVLEMVASLGTAIAVARQSEGAISAAAVLTQILSGIDGDQGITYGIYDGKLQQISGKDRTIN